MGHPVLGQRRLSSGADPGVLAEPWGFSIQIQDDYSGVSLTELATLGLEVYDLLPDYRQRCPLCGGVDCAVRHGLYHRRVTVLGGSTIDSFPIPRFRCRRRGPSKPTAATFSVLPCALVSRRRPSLSLMVWILELMIEGRNSIQTVLDALSERLREELEQVWFPEAPTLYRTLRLFQETEQRLIRHPIEDYDPAPPDYGPKQRLSRLLTALNHSPRASPLPLRFHRDYFPHLLFNGSL